MVLASTIRLAPGTNLFVCVAIWVACAAGVLTPSGGQKQRTAIAATLAMRPRVLVLDEPLSDLDPVGAQEVLGTLRRLARDHGTGVVVIEHRVDEVVPWADRIVLMDDGRNIIDRPPRGAWEDPGPWLATGVGIPDVVRLARAVPEAFGDAAPLSVEEAVAALRSGWFAAALASHAGGSGGRPHWLARRQSAGGVRCPTNSRPYCPGSRSACSSGTRKPSTT